MRWDGAGVVALEHGRRYTLTLIHRANVTPDDLVMALSVAGFGDVVFDLPEPGGRDDAQQQLALARYHDESEPVATSQRGNDAGGSTSSWDSDPGDVLHVDRQNAATTALATWEGPTVDLRAEWGTWAIFDAYAPSRATIGRLLFGGLFVAAAVAAWKRWAP